MEPIDFGGALVRRWWIPAVLALMGVIAALGFSGGAAPIASNDSKTSPVASWKWTSTAFAGVAPTSTVRSSSDLPVPLNIEQVAFYAAEPAVMESAAKAVGF